MKQTIYSIIGLDGNPVWVSDFDLKKMDANTLKAIHELNKDNPEVVEKIKPFLEKSGGLAGALGVSGAGRGISNLFSGQLNKPVEKPAENIFERRKAAMEAAEQAGQAGGEVPAAYQERMGTK